jgi:hypothetical protein
MGLEHLRVSLGPLLLLERRSRDLCQFDYLADPALVILLECIDGRLERLAVHDALHGLGVGGRDVLREGRT